MLLRFLQNSLILAKVGLRQKNHIPKGLVPLERLFDNNDVFVQVSGYNENVYMA
jgi:hypothetical protein